MNAVPALSFLVVIQLSTASLAAGAVKPLAIRSFETCPGLEPLAPGKGGAERLPLVRETLFSEPQGSWAGAPAGQCGPLQFWVSLDHVRHLSGNVSLNVRAVLHAEAPLLLLGLGWPTVLHAEDERGRVMHAPNPNGPMRIKVNSAVGNLDTVVSFSLDAPGRSRPPLEPKQIRRFRATIPAIVVHGFRPLVRVADPFGAQTAPVTRNGMTVKVENAHRFGQVLTGAVRVEVSQPDIGDIWNGFTAIPIVLRDSSGAVALRRWVQVRTMEKHWSGEIGFTETSTARPPYELVVYEPDYVLVDVPLEWESADVPPLRIEQPPVPPSLRK